MDLKSPFELELKSSAQCAVVGRSFDFSLQQALRSIHVLLLEPLPTICKKHLSVSLGHF